jgi:hypothetical protein
MGNYLVALLVFGGLMAVGIIVHGIFTGAFIEEYEVDEDQKL